jgi:hypothetical protein
LSKTEQELAVKKEPKRGPRPSTDDRWKARSLLVMGVDVKRVAYLIGRSESFVRSVRKLFKLKKAEGKPCN